MHGPIKPPKRDFVARVMRYIGPVGGSALALGAATLVLLGIAKPDDIGKVYAADVVVILICLDVLTRFFTDLGALDAAALAVARATRGEPRKIIWGIGTLMFAISAVLNNLAAVFAAAPIFLLIIRQLGAGPRATALILAVVLINTNLGGMATPIGDFPAIILMASGVISFKSYLFLAFPLALFTALVVTAIAAIVIPSMWAESDDDIRAIGRFAVEGLSQRMQFARPDWWIIGLLSLDFLAMIFTWAIANPAAWPFHYTAIAGTVIACIIVGGKSTSDVLATYDLKTTIFMAITLAIAAIASATGVLHALAGFLSAHIANPVLLLFVVMFCTTVAAAIFQAGPAAAAMLPIVAVLAEGGLKAYGDWVYVAFAGAICAGSSMFVWSATSGPALVGEAEKADIAWGIMKYLPYGLAAALLQFLIVALWVAYAVVPGLEFWYAATGFVFMIGGGVGLVVGPILTRHGRRNGRTEGDRDLHALGISIVRLSIVVELLGIMTKVVTWMW